jgi:hypothetical protein
LPRKHRSLALLFVASLSCRREAQPIDASRPTHPDADRAPPDAITTPPATRESPRRCREWTTISEGITEQQCAPGSGLVVVAMAGWRITAASTQRWLEALRAARLDALGATSLFAVEGPRRVDYGDKHPSIDPLRVALEARVARTPDARVLVLAHSSGAHVARTLFYRLFAPTSDAGSIAGRVVYVDLDGDRGIAADPERSFVDRSIGGLRRAVFVAARAGALRGFSMDAMREGAQRLAGRAELFEYDASSAGCRDNTCVHLSLINARPYARGNESYARFEQGPVNTAWLARAEPHLAPSSASP